MVMRASSRGARSVAPGAPRRGAKGQRAASERHAVSSLAVLYAGVAGDEFRSRRRSKVAHQKGACMLLEGKNAVIYGGGGAIGGAVARGLAREGARVFVAGRTQEPLEAGGADLPGAAGGCR